MAKPRRAPGQSAALDMTPTHTITRIGVAADYAIASLATAFPELSTAHRAEALLAAAGRMEIRQEWSGIKLDRYGPKTEAPLPELPAPDGPQGIQNRLFALVNTRLLDCVGKPLPSYDAGLAEIATLATAARAGGV